MRSAAAAAARLAWRLRGAESPELAAPTPPARAHVQPPDRAAFLVDDDEERAADRAARRRAASALVGRDLRGRRPAMREDHAAHVAGAHVREKRGASAARRARSRSRRADEAMQRRSSRRRRGERQRERR